MGPMAEPINVRLPVRTLERVKRESEQTGIQVSVLVRSAVMRVFPTPADGTENTTEPANNGAHGVNSAEMGTESVSPETPSDQAPGLKAGA